MTNALIPAWVALVRRYPDPLVRHRQPHHSLHEPPVDRDRRVRRSVLHGVLDEVLDDLAKARRIGDDLEANGRPNLEPVVVEQGSETRDHVCDQTSDVGRLEGRRLVGHDPNGREDRVDQTVEPLDLLERPAVPVGPLLPAAGVPRLATFKRRILGEQVGVCAHNRQRRPKLVGDERDELAPGLVDRLEFHREGFGLPLLPSLLDDAGKEVGDRPELGHVDVAELATSFGLDVEDADGLVVPAQRHRQHRGDEPLLVDAADPQEPRVLGDLDDDQRLTRGGDPPGNALAVRHPRPPDLVPVETVRRRERQVRSVPIEEVERGDVRVERVPGAVDNRLEQLVPRSRGRREAGDLVEELELLELGRAAFGRGFRDRVGRGHGIHDTSLGTERRPKRCGGVAAR